MKRRYSSHYAWRRAQSIDELAWMARQRLPAFAWEYVHGGSEDETTLGDNRHAFAAWGWQPRTLVDVEARDSRTRLVDSPAELPLAIAPTGYNGMLWRDGDIALARAAASRGLQATIVMPKDSPAGKIEGTKAYGASVVLYDRYTESREDISANIAAKTQAHLIKPYDDVQVIAGQGTCLLYTSPSPRDLSTSRMPSSA